MDKPDYFEGLIDYLANPFDARSYEEFAKEVNTNHTTLWRVRNIFREEIEREVEKRRKAMFDAMRVQAYKSLALKIRKDTNALKLFFQLSGDLIERTENVNKYESVEDKRSRIDMLLKSLGLTVTSINNQNNNKPNESNEPTRSMDTNKTPAEWSSSREQSS